MSTIIAVYFVVSTLFIAISSLFAWKGSTFPVQRVQLGNDFDAKYDNALANIDVRERTVIAISLASNGFVGSIR